MTIPPLHVAAVNSHPRRMTSTMPSSATRLVEANWNAMAAVKLPPLRKIDRVIATAA